MPRKPLDPVQKAVNAYMRGVLNGKIPAGHYIQAAVERHARDLVDGPARGLVFDPVAGARVCRFFGLLKHSKGEWAGQAFELSPFQMFIHWTLYGWKRAADGFRRYRTAYIEMPRKNGKTTLLAGDGLYLLTADGEGGAEIYTAATKRDQARLAHSEAIRMVKSSTCLQELIKCFRDNLNIEETNSKFEPLGGDTDTLDGLNPSGLIIDELHAHKSRRMFDVLDTATGSRRQPLLIAITTAGYDRNSVCWEQHDYTAKILDGILEDDSHFGFIAAIDKDDDWENEKTWFKANPNLEVSCKIDDMRRKAKKAKEQPTALNAFLRLHLGRWTEQDVRWLNMDRWDECDEPIDVELLKGRRCFAGLDLASVRDLCAFVLVFPPLMDGGTYEVLPWYWAPAEGAKEREKRDRVPYVTWSEQDLIALTPGDVTDYDRIRKDIGEIAEQYDIEEIAIDRWNSTQLQTQLTGDGFTVVPFGQGYRDMNPASKELERLVTDRKISHGRNPIQRWCASNVTVEMDPAGNIKPNKARSSEKIDGIVAEVMAIGRAIVMPEPQKSVYESRGLVTIG